MCIIFNTLSDIDNLKKKQTTFNSKLCFGHGLFEKKCKYSRHAASCFTIPIE